MNTIQRCLLTACAMGAFLGASTGALGQRVRFGSTVAEWAGADAGIVVASRPDHGITVVEPGTDPFSVAPLDTTAENSPYLHPPAAFGQAIAAPTLDSAWDPYRVARHARFTGTISSVPMMPTGGLPQPMPRVPYYTQQPVAPAMVAPTSQPYVVIPEAPAVSPSAPAGGSIVLPGATPPPIIDPPAVPSLSPMGGLAGVPVVTGHCYALVDAIYFTRDARLGNNLLVGAVSLMPDTSVLRTADLDFGWEFGPRVTLGREFGGFRAIEASYFGIYDFQDSQSYADDTFFVVVPGAELTDGYAGPVDQVSVTYDSIVQSGEINYLQHYGNIAWLAGFRYFNLGEKFALASTDGGAFFSDSRVSVYNNLFGAQLGGRIRQACGRWSYDLTGKAGVYGNSIHTSQRSVLETDTLIDQKTTGSRVSFLGELGLNGSYELNPNWSLRGGYQIYWIEGVGLATNQIAYDGSATPSLNKNGGVFMQGAHAGLMARW